MKKIIIFLLIGSFIINTGVGAKSASKRAFMKNINTLFLKEDYKGVIGAAGSNLREYRFTTEDKKEILYLAGLSYTKTGNFEKARESFGKILDMKGNDVREKAYMGIANSYFEEGKADEAIEAYENVLSMYPRSDWLASVYYNLGSSYKSKGNLSKANSYFGKVERQYDTSFEAEKTTYSPGERKSEFYIVQLGVFKDMKNAKALVRKLKRKRYDSYIQKIKRDGDILYRVRGGKFSNEGYAARLLKKLKKDGFQAKIIEE
ncbi:MAG: tetratricopeptide repeat protein [Candidatus Omnitrophica bacterium]|nr:tetratricopeptide repeat protein [Candidatus Omnitrophota bacterium]